MTNSEQFILFGPSYLLRALAQLAEEDPNIELLKISGPAHEPERLVIRMPETRADLLRRALGPQLRVEFNAPFNFP